MMLRLKSSLLLLLLTLLLPTAGWSQASSTVSADLDWQSFEKAVASAKQHDKNILVDIYAPWCPWCRKMQSKVYPQDKIKGYLEENFEIARLDGTNTDQQYDFRGLTMSAAQLAQALGMEGTPTTVFLRPDGTYIAHRPGYIEADEFLSMLQYIEQEAYTDQTYQEYLNATQ